MSDDSMGRFLALLVAYKAGLATYETISEAAAKLLGSPPQGGPDDIGTIYHQSTSQIIDNLPENLKGSLKQVAGEQLWSTLIGGQDFDKRSPRGSSITTASGDTRTTTKRFVDLPPTDRYSKLRPHAQGGLGQVFVAIDEELNRHVALKQIRDRFVVDPEARQRFILEAEITGGLEHPGIVPVYGLGLLSDGQPYYAMRFVRGESLQDAIRELHVGQKLDSERLFAMKKLIGRLVDVCQAVGYAHSRGVLHRDIKPENIMLGKFGETLLVDWGLAKIADQPSDETSPTSNQPATSSSQASAHETKVSQSDSPVNVEDATTIQPLRPSSVHAQFSQQGQVVGTPAYMSPEQAFGNIHDIREQSDVYSLGATLYAILVGRPAIFTQNVHEPLSLDQVLQLVRENRITPLRQAAPWIPKPLAAICERAMAAKPSDRYESPIALSDDLERWMADEPVQAYRENFLERSRRWIKRHQALSATTAAAILIGLFALGGVSIVLRDKNQSLAAMAQSLRQSNGELVVAQEQAQREAATAQAVSEFLNKDLLSQASPREHPNPRLEVRTVLERAFNTVDNQFQQQPLVKAQLLKTVGVAFQYLGEYPKADDALQQAVALFEEHSGVNAKQTLESKASLGSVKAHLGSYASSLELLTSALGTSKTLLGPSDPLTLDIQYQLAGLYTVLSRYDEARELFESTLESYRQVLGRNHVDTLTCEAGLVDLLNRASKYDESLSMARDLYQRSLDAFGADHLVTIEAQLIIAQRLQFGEQYVEAQKQFDDLIPRAQRLLGDLHPGVLIARLDRANIEASCGNPLLALKQQQELVELIQAVYGPGHREVLLARSCIGALLGSLGRYDESLEIFESTLSLAEKNLGMENLDTQGIRFYMAQTLIGDEQLEAAETLLQQIISSDSKGSSRGYEVMLNSRVSLASLHLTQGDYDKALDLAQYALEGYLRMSSDIGLAFRIRAGNIVLESLIKLDRVDQAEAFLQKVEEHPNAKDYDIGWARMTMADALIAQGQNQRADSLLTKLIDWSQSIELPNAEQAALLTELSLTFSGLERNDEAIGLLKKAVDGLASELGAQHINTLTALSQLAQIQYELEDFAAAEESYLRLVEGNMIVFGLSNDATEASLDLLTGVLIEAKKPKQAIPWLEKLRDVRVSLKASVEDVAIIDFCLADCFVDLKDYDQAIARFQAYLDALNLIEGEETAQQLYGMHQLAWCLSNKGKLQQSIDWYRRAVRQRGRVLGPAHEYTLLSFANLVGTSARLLKQPGQVDAATQQLAKGDLKALGNLLLEQPTSEAGIADAAQALGEAYSSLGEHLSAKTWLQLALDGKTETLGHDDLSTVSTQHLLGVALLANGDHAEALELLRKVVVVRERLLGPKDPATCDSLYELAQCTSTVDLSAAYEIFERARDRFNEVHGENNVSVLKPLVGMGLVRHQQGDYPGAILHYRKCLEIAYRNLAAHPEADQQAEAQIGVGTLLIALADAELGDRRLEDANLHVNEGLKLLEKSSPDQWSCWRGRSVQGGIQLARGQYDSAKGLLKNAYEYFNKPNRVLSYQFRMWFLRDSIKRLIAVCEAEKLPEEAAKWRDLLPK